MKLYRCWYKNGSARTVHARDHAAAAGTAQELAGIEHAPRPNPATQPDDYAAYLAACRVIKTECLTAGDDSVKRWKA